MAYNSNLSNGLSVVSQALSVETAARISAVNTVSNAVSVLSTVVSNQSSAITANSADVTSLKDRVSANSALISTVASALSTRIDVVSNAVSALALNSLVDVSTNGATDGQALMYNSVQGQWVASTLATGVNSVTSNEVSTLIAEETSNRISADNILGNLISALSVIVSNQGSAIVTNSADVTSLKDRVSANSALTSNLQSAIIANSAQMSVIASALSQQISVLSVVVSNEISARNALSVIVSNAQSAITTNSTDTTSLKNRVSANSALLSDALSAIVANSALISTTASALSTRIDVVSNALSALVLNSLADVSTNGVADGQILMFNSVENQWVASSPAAAVVSVTSNEMSLAIAVETSNRISADNALSNLISALSTQLSLQISALSQVHSALSANVVTISLNLSALSTRADVISNNLSQNSVILSNAVSAIVANSADVTSLKTRVGGISADFTSFKASLNNFGDVSTSSPSDGQVLMFNTSAGQWFNSTIPSASVTSQEVSLAVGVETSNRISADNVLSANINTVSNAVSIVSVNAAAALAVANAASNAASIVSVAQATTSVAVTSVNNRVSAISTDVTSIRSVVSSMSTRLSDLTSVVSALSQANSAAHVSINNAISVVSNAVSVLSQANSVAHASIMAAVSTKNPTLMILSADVSLLSSPTSFNFTGAGVQVSVSGTKAVISIGGAGAISVTSTELSAVSAAAASGIATVSNAVSALSQVHSALSADVVSLKDRVSANSALISTIASALSVRIDTASNAASIVSVAQATTSADLTSVKDALSALSANVAGISTNVSAISTRLSALSSQVATNSADVTSFKTSLNNFGDVSIASPIDQQFLIYNSAQGQWVNSTVNATASVTSQEMSLAIGVETSNRVSADNALSAAMRGPTTYVVAANDSPTLLKTYADYICDGTADESEINTALALGNVKLCEGTYNITTTGIQMPSNTTLSGEGDGTILTAVSFTGADKLITASGTTNITVRDLKITGSGLGYGIFFSLVGSGSGATAVTGALIENIYVNDIDYGVYFESCRNGIIRNIKGTLIDFSLIKLAKKVGESKGCVYINVDNINSFDSLNSGIWITDSEFCQVTNSIIEGTVTTASQFGIRVDTANTHILLKGNTISSTGDAGIYLSSSTYTNVIGNKIYGTAEDGINCESSDYTLISGNHISYTGTYGIDMEGQHCAVVGNEIIGAGQDNDNIYSGIEIGSSDCMVVGNKFWQGTLSVKPSYGIRIIFGANRNMIEGNMCYQAGTLGDINVHASAVGNILRDNAAVSGGWILDDVTSTIAANSADFTSFKASINNFADVSIASPADQQYLIWNSAASQWVNSTVPPGAASVTSAEYLSLVNRVSANSANGGTASVTSAEYVSTVSIVSTLQWPAVESVTSATYSVVEADRGKIKYFNNTASIEVILPDGLTSGFQTVIFRGVSAGPIRFSATTSLESQGSVLGEAKTGATLIHRGSNLWLAAGALATATGGGSVTSAEYTSALDRLSALSTQVTSVQSALSALSNQNSVDHVSIRNLVSVVSNAVSIVSAAQATTSAELTSVKNALSVVSNAVSIVSAANAVTSAAVTSVNQVISVLSQQVSVLSARVADNSADVTSFKASINNFADVSIDTPVDQQILVWNSAAAQWVNSTIAAGAASVTSAEYISTLDRISGNSANITSLANAISVISAGLGGVQMGVMTTGAISVSATPTRISGLSISVVAGGIYQLEGLLIMNGTSTTGAVLSTSAATFTHAALRWKGNLSIGTGPQANQSTWVGNGYFDETGFNSVTFSALPTTTLNRFVRLDGVVVISTTGGKINVAAKGGATNAVTTVKKGSYIRAYRIG